MGKSSNKLTQTHPAPLQEQAQISNQNTKSTRPKRRSQIIRLDEVAQIKEETAVVPIKPEPIPGPMGLLHPQTEANLNLLLKLYPAKISYSIEETASVLGLSYEFTRDSIKKGIIKSQKFGDRQMVNIHELARLLTEGIK